MRVLAALIVSAGLAASQATAGTLPLMGAGPSSAGVPFTPADLPDLFAWYEADRQVFTDTSCTTPATDTQAVACWGDNSGNNRNMLQATAGNRPTYLSSGMNSLPAIDLNAADEECMLTATNSITPPTAAAASGLAVVDMHAGSEAFSRVLAYAEAFSGDNASTGIIIAQRVNTNDELQSFRGTGVGTQTFTTGTGRAFSVIYDGADGVTYVNDAGAQTSANTNVFAGTGVMVIGVDITGSQTCGTQYFDGRVCLLVMTTSTLDAGERAALQSYAATECGL